MFELFCLQAVETKAHLICSSLGRSWLNREGTGWGISLTALNGFHYTSAKSMTFFFIHLFSLFCRILYPLHICLLHNILYPHSSDLPASILQTSAYDMYYKLLLFSLSSHTLSQKASMSSAALFMLRKV